MAADHFLARQTGQLLDRPLLRFFTWKPFCVSLGYHQNEAEVDIGACHRQEIDVVRRPTGGRAILHAQELTYSLIYPFKGMDVMNFYRLAHLPFVDALQELDIPAEYKPAQADFRTFYTSDHASVCFAASAKYEVEIHDKKVIGSAQRVYENAILQHGSLLLGPFHRKLVQLLNLPVEKSDKIARYVQQHTAHLWQYRHGITAGMLAEKVMLHFARRFGIRFIPLKENDGLTEAVHRAPEEEFSISAVSLKEH